MKYIMTPMLEDSQAGPSVELSRVSNTGVTEQLEVSDLYEEAAKYMSSK